MATTSSNTRQQQVEEAIAGLLANDEHGNDACYFYASDLKDIDPGLSSPVIGSYLPKIRDASPLPDGTILELYTKRRGGPSLWLARTSNK